MASQLLYCITSITPRARYFSFIPWSIHDYQQREKGKPHALGLRDAIVLREQALTLACVAHHQGRPCKGGALVGSRDAGKWFTKHQKEAKFRTLKKFAKNPALAAYLNSLVNLGVFLTEEERPDTDEESDTEDVSFDDIELSGLGLELATRYDSVVGNLSATRQLATKDRICSMGSLRELGKRGGLCELPEKSSVDRELLRDIFFAVIRSKGDSHAVRRKSLLLILEFCRQFSSGHWFLDESNFASAVYYGSIVSEGDRLAVSVPAQLTDIATRWRMFYFHHYMAVALEALFSWLVCQLGSYGLAGATVESLIAGLNHPSVRKGLSELLQVDLIGPFGDASPSTLFPRAGVIGDDLDVELSELLDESLQSLNPFAEDSLEGTIRGNEHLYSSTGLALPLILLATTLARYTRWEATNFGKWLAGSATDPYLDLIPPLLTMGLSRRFGSWWKCTWRNLAGFVLSRYVIQQHQAMSYEKSWRGDRCLLQADGAKVFSTGGYEKIGMGNARLGSAIQVLVDLGLLEDDEDGVTNLTTEGKHFLSRELTKETGK